MGWRWQTSFQSVNIRCVHGEYSGEHAVWNASIFSDTWHHKVSSAFVGGDSPFYKLSEELVIEKEDWLWHNYMPVPGEMLS